MHYDIDRRGVCFSGMVIKYATFQMILNIWIVLEEVETEKFSIVKFQKFWMLATLLKSSLERWNFMLILFTADVPRIVQFLYANANVSVEGRPSLKLSKSVLYNCAILKCDLILLK